MDDDDEDDDEEVRTLLNKTKLRFHARFAVLVTHMAALEQARVQKTAQDTRMRNQQLRPLFGCILG